MGWAQTFQAILTGRVLHPSGALIPGAQIRATANATGVSHETVLHHPAAPPGRYEVRASSQGFASVTVKGVIIEVGARQTLDIELTVDSTGTSIQVVADSGALQLKTESGERSEVITNRQIRDLAPKGATSST